jgi:hypothetical protein
MWIDQRASIIACSSPEPKEIIRIVEKENGIWVRDNRGRIIAEETGPKRSYRIG